MTDAGLNGCLRASSHTSRTLPLVWADSAYQGLKAWLSETPGWTLTISKNWWTGLPGV